jgi:hypothetical protein
VWLHWQHCKPGKIPHYCSWLTLYQYGSNGTMSIPIVRIYLNPQSTEEIFFSNFSVCCFIKAPKVGCPRNNQIFFGSNRNKPKHNLFWFIFGLFCKTKKLFFWFVSVFWIRLKTTETNRFVSKQTEKNENKSKNQIRTRHRSALEKL